ncbi:MAG: energy transducer TonB, partial [Burkholderiales bacterium]
ADHPAGRNHLVQAAQDAHAERRRAQARGKRCHAIGAGGRCGHIRRVARASRARGRGLTPLFRVEPVYPREAIRARVEKGNVVARLDVDGKGLVTAVHIIESEPPRVFDREVIRALSQWKFQADGQPYVAEIEIGFTLKDN